MLKHISKQIVEHAAPTIHNKSLENTVLLIADINFINYNTTNYLFSSAPMMKPNGI